MDAPTILVPPRFIHSLSRYSTFSQHNWTFQSGTTAPASATWPTASKALYMPLLLPFRFHLRRFFIANGGSVSGNFDIGLFTRDGRKLASTGSTAQSGTNTTQYAGTFDVILQPAGYYLAVVLDNTTGTMARQTVVANIVGRMAALLEEASAFPLPATMTPATITTGIVPLCGFTSTASGF